MLKSEPLKDRPRTKVGAATLTKQTTKSKAKKVKMSEQAKHEPAKEETKAEPVKKEAPQAPAVSEGNIKAGIVIS